MKNQKDKPIKKEWFDVKIEALVPTTIVYRVQAESAEKAIEEIQGFQKPIDLKQKIASRRNIKASVYQAGSTMIKYIKNYGAR